MSWTIYYDEVHEGIWFRGLHPALADVPLESITDGLKGNAALTDVLRYDRPDIILAYEQEPAFILERTVEVPSGHNVGQRFARLAAAAEARKPVVFFGPFVARKHGGETAGPRYMNLRLFGALDVLASLYDTAVTAIQWPVDEECEVLQVPEKDEGMKRYMETFFEEFERVGAAGISSAIKSSAVQQELLDRREKFVATVKRAAVYDHPPNSVRFLTGKDAAAEFKIPALAGHDQLVIYNVGMSYVRSDPYTGTAMLYRYLYVLGHPELDRRLILHFPKVDEAMWDLAAGGDRKDVRLYRHVADGIIFSNAYRDKSILIAAPDF